MKRILAGLLLLQCLDARFAHAQFVAPVPVRPPVVVAGDGVGFLWARKNFVVSGSIGPRVYGVLPFGGYAAPFPPVYSPAPWSPVPYAYPIAPFGIQQNRITIQVVNPQPIVIGGFGGRDGTEGIDLDAIPVKRPAPPPRPEPRDEPPPRVEPRPPMPEPGVKLPGVDVSQPKPAVRPDDVPPQQQPKPKAEAPRPQIFGEEADRMVQGGLSAFREGRYGLAVLRFVQAAELNPMDGKAKLLLAQGQLALGKYPEAMSALEAGLKLEKNWPLAAFNLRADLYKGQEADLDAQLKRLEDVQARQPNDPLFGFLLAYQYWFDGRRGEAVALFRRIRPLMADTTPVDHFLAAAGPAAVAAR